MTESLSGRVQRLLRDHMTSFERLAVLMFLFDHGVQEWSTGQVSEHLRVPLELAHDALVGLESSGLVQRSGDGAAFRYAPAAPALAAATEELAVAYREQRAAVMSAMSIYAIERIRSGPMRAFADAFLVGKRRDDDG
jgi:hypothetical protein